MEEGGERDVAGMSRRGGGAAPAAAKASVMTRTTERSRHTALSASKAYGRPCRRRHRLESSASERTEGEVARAQNLAGGQFAAESWVRLRSLQSGSRSLAKVLQAVLNAMQPLRNLQSTQTPCPSPPSRVQKRPSLPTLRYRRGARNRPCRMPICVLRLGPAVEARVSASRVEESSSKRDG